MVNVPLARLFFCYKKGSFFYLSRSKVENLIDMENAINDEEFEAFVQDEMELGKSREEALPIALKNYNDYKARQQQTFDDVPFFQKNIEATEKAEKALKDLSSNGNIEMSAEQNVKDFSNKEDNDQYWKDLEKAQKECFDLASKSNVEGFAKGDEFEIDVNDLAKTSKNVRAWFKNTLRKKQVLKTISLELLIFQTKKLQKLLAKTEKI